MKVEFEASKPSGKIAAPPSKSMAHRLLICAALAKGKSEISNVAFSQDILATLDCLETLGAKIEIAENKVLIDGIEKFNKDVILDCRESGSTLRFLFPISIVKNNQVKFVGKGRLLSRPMEEYRKISSKQDIGFEMSKKEISVCGKLKSDIFEVNGDVSSQFITGLLFSLPLLENDSSIVIKNKLESKPYVDMTVDCLEKFGVKVVWKSENEIFVKGNQEYICGDFSVEGDYSNSAFFIAMGEKVQVDGLDENSLQGDKVFKKHYEQLLKEKVEIDITDCPDLGPVLFAVASQNHGAVFEGTRRLRIKESDRAESMKTELEKFGVRVEILENSVIIDNENFRKPSENLFCHNDHRIAMALSVLLIKTGGTLDGAECVKKSMPDFFEMTQKLNVRVKKYDS